MHTYIRACLTTMYIFHTYSRKYTTHTQRVQMLHQKENGGRCNVSSFAAKRKMPAYERNYNIVRYDCTTRLNENRAVGSNCKNNTARIEEWL